MKMNTQKTIHLISTGGTIASAPGEDGRNISGALTGEALAQSLVLDASISLHVHSLLQKPSNAITPADWLKIVQHCQQLIQQQETDGIVITHGTDTLEDTAYCLHCVLDTARVPIIVTGSQRVPHALGSDAHANLKAAIDAAASGSCRDTGVLVAFNESLFSAAFARKVSSFQLNGFDAPGLGSQGFIDQGQVTMLQRPARQALLPLPVNALPRVEILPIHAGASIEMLDAILSTHPAGLVIDAVGRGHVPPDWMPSLQHAIGTDGLPVLITSNTLHGAIHPVYQFAGSLHELMAAGAIGVRHLSARKARIRLALLLANGQQDSTSIQQAFEWQVPV
ncbi:MAG: asparaginase [Lautropia sp.]|nr:asparaginase [Lautropia sp.]